MDGNNWLTLLIAVVVALLSVVALRYLERLVSVRIGPSAVPDNIQALIAQVGSDMQARHKLEIDEMRSRYEAQLAHGERKIQELEAQLETYERKAYDLENRVNWLWSQLVAAGGKMPENLPPLPPTAPAPLPVIVLGIWPASDLSIRAEIDAIFRSGIKYEVLDSNVTRSRLLAEVDRLKPGILHVGAHATADGVQLDDGLSLLGWWRNLAALYPFSLVVLNACESLDIVDSMQDAGVTAVVGMRKGIGDRVAVEFARQFYGWLLRGRTVQAAATLSKMGLTHTDAELIVARGDWSLK